MKIKCFSLLEWKPHIFFKSHIEVSASLVRLIGRTTTSNLVLVKAVMSTCQVTYFDTNPWSKPLIFKENIVEG